jgi:hypothetical protein
MLGFTKVFFLVLSVVSLGAEDLILRAIEIRHPLLVTHVDSIELRVSSSLNPYLQLKGRQCLFTDKKGEFCDYIEHDFQLPAEVRVSHLRIFLVSNGAQSQKIGSLSQHQSGDGSVELAENVSLFYDRYYRVPGLVFSGKSEALRVRLSRMKKFRSLYGEDEE